jgi:hypothetical protein
MFDRVKSVALWSAKNNKTHLLWKGKQSAHDSGMTFCTFIRYAQSQIIKKKEFDGKKTN